MRSTLAGQLSAEPVGTMIIVRSLDPDHTVATQGMFSTLPGNGAYEDGVTDAFFDQVVGTASLVFVVFALTTAPNSPPLANAATDRLA
jgi:glycerol uptake facilitator protein